MTKDDSKYPHRFGPPGPVINPDLSHFPTLSAMSRESHSWGVKPHPHKRALARLLLDTAGHTEIELKAFDDRPLIDHLHEATFSNPIGLQWIEDKYALRTIVKKTHRFTVDSATSAMIVDFSTAILPDLESARRLAVPPFDYCWFDIDNRARLKRTVELGGKLTPTAAGETEAGEPVERIGWLIQPGDTGGWFASYVCLNNNGILMAPLSYWWQAGSSRPYGSGVPEDDDTARLIRGLTFGVAECNVYPIDAYIAPTPLHNTVKSKAYGGQVRELMQEIAGELRHVWGLLIALGAGQFGSQALVRPAPLWQGTPPTMKNGKTLLPLEHKELHLHLKPRHTAARVLARAITHHRHRWHEVRGHFRTLRNKDGSVRKRVPVKPHERGDEKLGRIEKTYRVEK